MAERGFATGGLVIGLAILAAAVLTALVSLLWTPVPPAAMDIAARLQGPSPAHWLGTDTFGRDTASMLMVGLRHSLTAAFLAVLIGAGLGIPLGAYAAVRGGWPDELVMRGNDLLFAFPAVLTAAMLVTVLGPSLWVAVVSIGVFNIPVFARVTRGGAVRILERSFVQAARMSGKSMSRITVDHVLPNILDQLIVQLSIQLAVGILAEAGLGYLGLSIPPPAPTLGKMLADAQTMLALAPRLAILPGLAIALVVLGFNLVGDGLRDRLDPRLAQLR